LRVYVTQEGKRSDYLNDLIVPGWERIIRDLPPRDLSRLGLFLDHHLRGDPVALGIVYSNVVEVGLTLQPGSHQAVPL
jgi:hypothetical protein